MDAAGLRKQLQVVFASAPDCVEAKLLEAELLLQDKDYGGKQQSVTAIVWDLGVRAAGLDCHAV